MRPAARPAARSAIAGRAALGCSAWKPRATGQISRVKLELGSRPEPLNRTRIDAFGLFTGQVGYAWNNALLYVKGGAAVTDNRYAGLLTGTGIVVDRTTATRWGGTVGVGLEYGFAPNWSAGVEYDHLFMGTQNNAFTSVVSGRWRQLAAPIASARTSTWSPPASTTVGVARSSRSTDLRLT